MVTTQASARPKENFRFGFGAHRLVGVQVSSLGSTLRRAGLRGSLVLIGFLPYARSDSRPRSTRNWTSATTIRMTNSRTEMAAP